MSIQEFENSTTLLKVYDLSHHQMGERLEKPTMIRVNLAQLLMGLFPKNSINLMASAN